MWINDAINQEKGAPLLVMLGVISAAGGRPAFGSDFQLKPSLSLSEEFNDNILETATGKRSDWVTRVLPGATLLYRTPSLNGGAAYTFDYRNYARGTRGDEMIHSLALQASSALKENFLYIELSDTLSRVSLDVARDVTTESSFVNQIDQNTASISPYLLWRPGEKMVVKTGYRYSDTIYLSSSGVDKRVHSAYADLSRELGARLNLTAGYAFSRVDTTLVDYNEHDVSVGMRYEYADKSFLFGGVGNSWQIFPTSNSASNLFWNAGVTNDFGFLVATVESKVQYVEDPQTSSNKETSYSGGMEKTLLHGSVGLIVSYSEYVTTLTGAKRRKGALTGSGRYEISPRLMATVGATGDRVTQESASDYPYHFNASLGVNCGFNCDITAALTYTYVGYRLDLDSTTGAKQINRVIAELRKVF